nr:MAG TPA: hypothetical protein [Microviridae sp.]
MIARRRQKHCQNVGLNSDPNVGTIRYKKK